MNLNYNDSTEPGEVRSNYFQENALIFEWRVDFWFRKFGMQAIVNCKILI